jgi:hypothetical protein
MSLRLLTSIGLLCALVVTPALAGSYKFMMHNNSKYAIVGFETYEDGKWSKWTGVDIPPGSELPMDWQTDKGDCNVPFKIIYKDIETEQYTVDWCKISHIRVNNDNVTAD